MGWKADSGWTVQQQGKSSNYLAAAESVTSCSRRRERRSLLTSRDALITKPPPPRSGDQTIAAQTPYRLVTVRTIPTSTSSTLGLTRFVT